MKFTPNLGHRACSATVLQHPLPLGSAWDGRLTRAGFARFHPSQLPPAIPPFPECAPVGPSAGYCGVTWWTSRPCATPEETLTFCAAILGTATGMSLTMFDHAVRNPIWQAAGDRARHFCRAVRRSFFLLDHGDVFWDRRRRSQHSIVEFAGLLCGRGFRKRPGSDALILRLGLFFGLGLRTGSVRLRIGGHSGLIVTLVLRIASRQVRNLPLDGFNRTIAGMVPVRPPLYGSQRSKHQHRSSGQQYPPFSPLGSSTPVLMSEVIAGAAPFRGKPPREGRLDGMVEVTDRSCEAHHAGQQRALPRQHPLNLFFGLWWSNFVWRGRIRLGRRQR